jgi:hypothetical protein
MSSMCFTLAMRPIERFVVPPNLAGTFRDFVRHREDLSGLLVEKEVIIPGMWT